MEKIGSLHEGYTSFSQKYELFSMADTENIGFRICFLLAQRPEAQVDYYAGQEEGDIGAASNSVSASGEKFQKTYSSLDTFLNAMKKEKIDTWSLRLIVNGAKLNIYGSSNSRQISVSVPKKKSVNAEGLLESVEQEIMFS